MKYGHPTTRRYPRTLAEAYPNDPDHAQWWFPPEYNWRDRALFWLSVAAWVVLCIYWYLT